MGFQVTGDAESLTGSFRGSLGDFSLDVRIDMPMRGVTALFGPSGSGKTTILRCVAGLSRMAGHLTVGGSVWQDDDNGVFRKPHTRAIGYVFQEASLFPHLSVRQNMLYAAKGRTSGESVRGLAFDDVVDFLGARSLLDRNPAGLSGGERQRVAIGRALLSQPRLLLMDEPLSALDRGAKEEILPYLESLHEALDVPVLYVSHDIGEASRLADRMIVLSKGRIAAEGTIDDVLQRLDLRPETGRFEAGVILRAKVISNNPDFLTTQLDLQGQSLTIPGTDLPAGQEIRIRIRARDVALATERPVGISIRNVLSGTIDEIVEEQDSAFAETLIDLGGPRLRVRITRDALAELQLTVGMPVYALIKSVSFDRRTMVAVRG